MPKLRQFLTISTLACVSTLSLSHSAQAHHAMDGRMPSTFAEGFLSGLGHPVLGLDHLAFIVAIGIFAALSQRLWMPALFVGASFIGTNLHLWKLTLPFAEPTIALSVIALGALLAFNQRLSQPWLISLGTIAGLFHGYAFGESIFGAEPTPLVAYLAGLAVMEAAIAYGCGWLTQKAITFPHSHSIIRAIGGLVALVGVTALAGVAIG